MSAADRRGRDFLVRDYLGTPFVAHGRAWSGVDCWGLACLLYAREFDIHLPHHADEVADVHDPVQTGALITRHRGDDWRGTAAPRRGDLVLFLSGGIPYHIGVYLNDKEFMHTIRGAEVQVTEFDSPGWPRRRVAGCYIHHRLI